jgi:hypothetical protein
MILYGTAMATEAGPVQFFDDIYGHDRKLEELLFLRPVNGTATARWRTVDTALSDQPRSLRFVHTEVARQP